MNSVGHKTLAGTGSLLLLLFVSAGVFMDTPVLFFTPVLILVVLFFIRYPQLLFYTLLAAIPWSVEFMFTESLGSDLPDEPLMLLTAFVAVALIINNSRTNAKSTFISPLLVILLLGFAWSIVTTFTSTHFTFSAKYVLAKGWYLLAFVGAPLLLKGDTKLVRKAAVVLFISMFLVTCTSMVKHAVTGLTFATINAAVAPFFRNHVNYSALLVFMVPLQLAFYKLTPKKQWRILVVFSLLLVLTALYFSYARGAWIALLAGLVAYWLLNRGWLFRSYILFLIALASFVYWLQQNDRYLSFAPKHDITVFHEDFTEHLVATYKGKDVSTAERFYRWVAGARMALEKPATGFGPTTFYQHYRSYTVPAFRTWVSNNPEQSTVHNYFLLLLIEQGIPGMGLFLLLLGSMFWHAQKIYARTTNRFWKTVVATIAAILWMQVTLNSLSDLIETDKVGSVFYLCLAFLVIAAARTKEETIPEKE